jgi:quinol monooxygenase YgiN
MLKFAIYAHLKPKSGKASEVESLLKSAVSMAQDEPGTVTWYAFAEDEGSFGIFDTFETEDARQAHLDGPIAKALMSKADELLSEKPMIHKIRIVAAKVPTNA